MDGIVARDPRVWAILNTPDEYFATARRQAWLRAKEEVAADLARRAQQRRNESMFVDAWRAAGPGRQRR